MSSGDESRAPERAENPADAANTGNSTSAMNTDDAVDPMNTDGFGRPGEY
jgi:hypothetical protein